MLAGGEVAGVLVEARQARGRRTFVVGVGINVNAAPSRDALAAEAVCLAEALGDRVERIEVVRAVLRRLDDWAQRIARGRLDALRERWLARCGMINQRVRVRCGGQCYAGRALDVSPLEGLVLCCDDGRRVHLPAEASTVLD